jgi:CheY-like chemotaxis protein
MKVSQRRVLIVDDDQHLLEVLQLWFEKANLAVVTAANGEQAIEILNGPEPPAFVLTDFMMPALNGIELVRLLKANFKLFATPVVMMSNNSDPEFRKKAMQLGAAAFLLKTDGARLIVENSIRAAMGTEAGIFESQMRLPLSAVQVQAMRESLIALLRLTSRTEGLPTDVRDALISADKLVEELFAAVQVN